MEPKLAGLCSWKLEENISVMWVSCYSSLLVWKCTCSLLVSMNLLFFRKSIHTHTKKKEEEEEEEEAGSRFSNYHPLHILISSYGLHAKESLKPLSYLHPISLCHHFMYKWKTRFAHPGVCITTKCIDGVGYECPFSMLKKMFRTLNYQSVYFLNCTGPLESYSSGYTVLLTFTENQVNATFQSPHMLPSWKDI